MFREVLQRCRCAPELAVPRAGRPRASAATGELARLAPPPTIMRLRMWTSKVAGSPSGCPSEGEVQALGQTESAGRPRRKLSATTSPWPVVVGGTSCTGRTRGLPRLADEHVGRGGCVPARPRTRVPDDPSGTAPERFLPPSPPPRRSPRRQARHRLLHRRLRRARALKHPGSGAAAMGSQVRDVTPSVACARVHALASGFRKKSLRPAKARRVPPDPRRATGRPLVRVERVDRNVAMPESRTGERSMPTPRLDSRGREPP